MEQLYDLIAGLGKKYHAGKIVLLGSRARGDNRELKTSDEVFPMIYTSYVPLLKKLDNYFR